MMAVDLAEDAGFEAGVASSADDAGRILETHPDIHIVFIDINTPDGVDRLKLAATGPERWPPI